MRVQLAKFDASGPGAPAADKVVARLLHHDETVRATSYGDLILPMLGRHRGKLFATDHRLILVPDRSVFPYPFWWRNWGAFDTVTLRGALWNARVTLVRDDREAPVGQIVGHTVVETTKALAREIERVWADRHTQPFGGEWADAIVLDTGKLVCESCGFNPDDPLRCGACGRRLRWAGVLGEVVVAAHDPAGTLPEHFPDGAETSRAFLFASLATLAMAATIEDKQRWLDHLSKLLTAMRACRPEPASTFGVMPILKAVRDHENSQRIWEMARDYPTRLAPVSVPEPRDPGADEIQNAPGAEFNVRPGWPPPPSPGWMPPPGGQPDPELPPPPQGWKLNRRTGWHAIPRLGRKAIIWSVIGLLGLAFAYNQGQQESNDAPKIGECARTLGVDAIERVDCSDPQAELLVTSRHGGTTDIESACSTDSEATSGYSFEQQGAANISVTSFVLCLRDY